jgi:transposase
MGAERPGLVGLDGAGREALLALAAGERRVRVWRRYRALLLLGAGQPPAAVAAALGCSRASVYGWAAAWRRAGATGVRPSAVRGGRRRGLAGAGEALLAARLGADPQAHGYQATGWTVPLLLAELRAAGHAVGARTVRRTLHRLGWRWKRPKYVLGRPDPAYQEKKGA